MSDKDQAFVDAATSCKKEINREFIAQAIVNDKTNTLRKYLNSYGMVQLAYKLRDLAYVNPPHKSLVINIDAFSDKKQKRAQDLSRATQKYLNDLADGKIPAGAKPPLAGKYGKPVATGKKKKVNPWKGSYYANNIPMSFAEKYGQGFQNTAYVVMHQPGEEPAEAEPIDGQMNIELGDDFQEHKEAQYAVLQELENELEEMPEIPELFDDEEPMEAGDGPIW